VALFFPHDNYCSKARPGAVASARQLRFLALLLDSSGSVGRFGASVAIGARLRQRRSATVRLPAPHRPDR
jgi:hypothetical protein